MTYTRTSELPVTIREVLPLKAQELYLNAYNEALEMELAESVHALPRESMAHQLAWDAVTHAFVRDEGTGQWHALGEEPEPQVEEPRGLFQRLRGMFRPASV